MNSRQESAGSRSGPATGKAATPYWRLSGFYFFYFASIGVLVPYWALYLKSLNFAPREIGELIAVIMATKIIAPNVWGWLADHTGHRMLIVRLGSFAAMFAFVGVFFGDGYWWLVLVTLVFSFFWNAALPQFEATTFTHLGDEAHRYSSIRLWGSIGFIVAAAILGALLQSQGVAWIPWSMLFAFAGIWLMSLIVPERAAEHLSWHDESIVTVMRQPAVLALIAVACLMQLGHGPFYTFYTLYMEDHGYSRSVIGAMWAWGVIAEVGVFLIMYRLIPRFGLTRLLLFSLWVAALRWLLNAWFVDYPVVMLLAQTMHAATFGIYHAVTIQLVHTYFTGRHQNRGQALYSSMSFGFGGAIGSLYAGYTWESLGPGWTYSIASAVSALGALIAWRWVRERAPVV